VRVPFIDIRAHYQDVVPEIDQVTHEVLSSGGYVLGKHNKALEEELATLHGVKHGIAVNSGTDALRIAMDACGIKPGDEVITTAFTFVASVEVIVQLGAIPVFVDIEPHTFNIDPEKIREAISSKTRAILPIHLFGQLANVNAISAIAREHGLMVIEDAAQAVASHHNGAYAGKHGRAAGLSFYVTKNLGAAGDGGMILTDDDEVAELARSIRIHGMGRERYYYDYIGYTSRLDEIQAAVLRTKLTKLADWNARRGEIAARYLDELRSLDLRLPSIVAGNNHTWHQFTVRSPRREAMQGFLKEREIDSMIYYPVPIHYHAPYRRFGNGEGSLPETEAAAKEVLSLPVHPHMRDEQVEWVIESVAQFASPVGRPA